MNRASPGKSTCPAPKNASARAANIEHNRIPSPKPNGTPVRCFCPVRRASRLQATAVRNPSDSAVASTTRRSVQRRWSAAGSLRGRWSRFAGAHARRQQLFANLMTMTCLLPLKTRHAGLGSTRRRGWPVAKRESPSRPQGWMSCNGSLEQPFVRGFYPFWAKSTENKEKSGENVDFVRGFSRIFMPQICEHIRVVSFRAPETKIRPMSSICSFFVHFVHLNKHGNPTFYFKNRP